jgi:type IV pilus assembly protein PilX
MKTITAHCLSRAGTISPTGQRRQHGMSLFVVLIALVLLSLGAVGLIRMVDTGALIAGNLSFKQSTTLSADNATERAITWLETNYAGSALFNDDANRGYYASAPNRLDISGNIADPARTLIDWDSNNCAYAAAASHSACIQPVLDSQTGGITTRFLITRMCSSAGDPDTAGNNCARPVASEIDVPSERGKVVYGSVRRTAVLNGPYFRIVVRAEGPRKTISLTESYVHFPPGAIP